MIFGNAATVVVARMKLPSICLGVEDPTASHSVLGVVTSRHLLLAAYMLKIDFHRDEEKRETMDCAHSKKGGYGVLSDYKG